MTAPSSEKVRFFSIIVAVNLDCIETVDGHEIALKDLIECNFDEGNYIIIDDAFEIEKSSLSEVVGMSEDDLNEIVVAYQQSKQ